MYRSLWQRYISENAKKKKKGRYNQSCCHLPHFTLNWIGALVIIIELLVHNTKKTVRWLFLLVFILLSSIIRLHLIFRHCNSCSSISQKLLGWATCSGRQLMQNHLPWFRKKKKKKKTPLTRQLLEYHLGRNDTHNSWLNCSDLLLVKNSSTKRSTQKKTA